MDVITFRPVIIAGTQGCHDYLALIDASDMLTIIRTTRKLDRDPQTASSATAESIRIRPTHTSISIVADLFSSHD